MRRRGQEAASLVHSIVAVPLASQPDLGLPSPDCLVLLFLTDQSGLKKRIRNLTLLIPEDGFVFVG